MVGELVNVGKYSNVEHFVGETRLFLQFSKHCAIFDILEFKMLFQNTSKAYAQIRQGTYDIAFMGCIVRPFSMLHD
jgi:hypothetical protein